MKWIGQNIYDQLALFRGNVRVGGGNLYDGDGTNNNWIMIDCQDGGDTTGGGITFHEATLSGDVDFATPQYGAKIVFNEDDDEFSIGTIDNSTYKKQIKMDRGSSAVNFVGGITVGGGYGSTGATISHDGIGQFNGALTTDGALTGASISTAGNLTVSGTTSFTSSSSGRPSVSIANTGNNTEGGTFSFQLDKGAAGADNDIPGRLQWQSDNDAQEQYKFAEIYGTVADATDEQEAGAMYLKVAAYDGVLETGLKLDGDTNADGEVDVTIGTGAASVTTVAGTLTMGTTAAMTNAGLLSVANQSNITGVGTISSGEWRGTAIAQAYLSGQSGTNTGDETLSSINGLGVTTVGTIDTGVWNGTAIAQAYIAGDAINGDKIADNAVNSEHYTDGSIDTAHIGDDQVTFAKASGVTPNVYGNIIKLIPSDFMANDDGGNTKFGVGYVEGGGGSGDTSYGMRVANNATELYAFVSIPEGMKATHVDIFDKNDLAIEVFEVQINATTMVSKGSGNANTTLNITDVNSTATNFLAIVVTTTSATNDKVYGGQVTIAAQ